MKIKLRRGLALLLTLLLCPLSSGCRGKERQEVVLGLNLELSGRLAQYGNECLQGARLAEQELETLGLPYQVRLAVVDNRSENSDSVLGFLRLTKEEGAVCVIGPTTSAGVKAQLQCESPVPVIVPTATSDSLDDPAYQNRFRICFTDSAQGSVLGECAWAMGFRRAAVLGDLSSDYSQGTSQAFCRRFTELGGEIAARLSYTAGDTDFSVLLTLLRDSTPQAVFLPGYDAEAGLILRQARQMGLDCAFFSGDTFDSPVLEELAGEDLDRVYFSNHYDPQGERLQGFAARYEEEYGVFPSAYASLGYDSVMLFADALSRAAAPAPEAVAEALRETKGYPGVTGDITFDERQNAVKTPIINAIVKGERRVLRLRGEP